MARIPTTIRTVSNDIKDAPAWFHKFLSIQNTFNQAVYDAITGQLTFQENLRCQFKDITFTTSSTYSSGGWTDISFPNLLKTKAMGVLLMGIELADSNDPIEEAVSLTWYDVNGNIIIRWVSGLSDSTQYTMKVMVI